MPTFGDFERRMLSYFRKGTKVYLHGRELTVAEAGKPTCPYGEPKTDIYVEAVDCFGSEEIKISYKKENADFLENKTNADRAEHLFGEDWQYIIEQSTASIADRFLERMRIYKNSYRKAEAGSITLGWRFELLRRPGGDLSGEMMLSPDQVYDVYAGTTLPSEKRNASVNGRIIEDSGIADYLLISDSATSAQDVIDNMIPIAEYVERYPKIYFACKALNYRTYAQKYDGNRPLAVQVDWKIINGKLSSDLMFDRPLMLSGDEMAGRLIRYLERLGIETTDDINENNTDMRYVYE